MRQRGFTLLEVMVALAILAGGLVILLAAASANVAKTKRAQWLGVTTDLARAKMYDIEEMLLEDGFQELDKTETGDFGDEGWRQIEWKAEIEKIELPALTTLQSQAGEEGEEGGEDGEAPGGMLGGFLGAAGGADPSTAGGAGLIASQFQLVADVLERSIRKVTLTVTWKVNGKEQELVVNCYFTDPKAVSTSFLGGAAAAGAAAEGGDSDADSASGSGSGTNRSPTSSSRNSRGGSRGGSN